MNYINFIADLWAVVYKVSIQYLDELTYKYDTDKKK